MTLHREGFYTQCRILCSVGSNQYTHSVPDCIRDQLELIMKQTVNFSNFVDAFRAYDRYDQFGYQALMVIFEYLEELEESTGQELELDVVAICCDYATQNFADIAEAYGIELDPTDSEEDQKQQVKDFLEVETIVLGETDCEIVYQQF